MDSIMKVIPFLYPKKNLIDNIKYSPKLAIQHFCNLSSVNPIFRGITFKP